MARPHAVSSRDGSSWHHIQWEKCQVGMTRLLQALVHLFYSGLRAQMHIGQKVPSSYRIKVLLKSPEETFRYVFGFVSLTNRNKRPLNCNLSLNQNCIIYLLFELCSIHSRYLTIYYQIIFTLSTPYIFFYKFINPVPIIISNYVTPTYNKALTTQLI